VVFSIASMMAKNNNDKSDMESNTDSNESNRKPSFLSTSVISGFIIGMVIMYVTSLLIPS
jgi:F0F1-type ATP synthase assembly protein I